MWERLAEIFDDGDILYGMNDGRGAARDAILKHRRTVSKESVYFCFFKRTRNFERIIIQNSITNSVFDPTKDGLYTNRTIKSQSAVKSDPNRAIAFRDFLAEHPKYSMKSHQATRDMAEARAAWMKTSKAGLEFQAKKRKNYKIHFVLDGLDFEKVVLSQIAVSQTGPKHSFASTQIQNPRAITAAEIRWLFRRRNDVDVANAVTFWLAGAESKAPWQLKPALFANFLYTKDQMLADDHADEFGQVIRELKAALVIQRAVRRRNGMYYVRPGDSLEWIGIKLGVSVEDLMTWNNLPDKNIMVGERLITRPAPPVVPPGGQAQDRAGLVQSRIAFWESAFNPKK